MAEKIALLESYLSCHVCTETFTDPVSLSCNHSFCSSCLQQFWEQSENKNCPICKRRSSKDMPGVNFTLKELADSFAGRLKAEGYEAEKKVGNAVCGKHQEEPKLFCKEEQRILCTVCDFPHHPSHQVVPVGEALSELKNQLESDSESLRDRTKKYKDTQDTYKEMVQHSKKQVLSTERKIREHFNKLHQLLREEEESRLAALREEQEQKARAVATEMKMIEEKLSSFSHTITAAEEELTKEPVSFLRSYRATKKRIQELCSLSDPQLLPGVLIDEAKHLGNLSFRVWDKMKSNVTFSPVILDPNTAQSCLYLSDDLTSVKNENTHHELPDNPERHTKYATVLGSEGFSSGKHSWDVEVGEHPGWNVGVVKESADRKGGVLASPKYGFWCLLHRSGKYTNGLGETVKIKKSLQKIRVQLDYDRGDVSFYNAEDITHIYTHRDNFTEKLFPYFHVPYKEDAANKDIKICQTFIDKLK